MVRACIRSLRGEITAAQERKAGNQHFSLTSLPSSGFFGKKYPCTRRTYVRPYVCLVRLTEATVYIYRYILVTILLAKVFSQYDQIRLLEEKNGSSMILIILTDL